jgi:small-conductance mechanosensitive channel
MGVVTVTIVIILNSLLILLVKGKHAHSIPIFEQLKKLIDKRIKPLIYWGGMIFWFFITLENFGLLKGMKNWFDGLMATSFDVAGAPISIGGIISFSLIAFFTYVLARFVKNIFKDEWVSNTKMKQGTVSALSMSIRYTIVAFGIYLALTSAGVNINKFGFMAGALGVGIGFGLQNIVLNFIAGIILAFEQPIHIGDVIEVDQFMGRVTEIGVRASKIMTWNGSEVIVPNGLLISNKVVNWTHTDQKRRLEIPFKTAVEADPRKVLGILSATAEAHPNTLKTPKPLALFNGYGDSSLDFMLYCWVDFSMSLNTKSEIAINAHEALALAGIPIPVSMHKLQINQDIDDKLTQE